MAKHLLSLVTGEIVALNKTLCKGNETDEVYSNAKRGLVQFPPSLILYHRNSSYLQIIHFYWMGDNPSANVTGQCYKSTVKTTMAKSPAFDIEGLLSILPNLKQYVYLYIFLKQIFIFYKKFNVLIYKHKLNVY